MDNSTIAADFREYHVGRVEITEREDNGRLGRSEIDLGIENDGLGLRNDPRIFENSGEGDERGRRHVRAGNLV